MGGDLACIADGTSGLQVFDVSSPDLPVHASSIGNVGRAWGVTIDGPAGIHREHRHRTPHRRSVDSQRPRRFSPTFRCPTMLTGSRSTMARSPTVAANAAGLQIVDASDPSSPAIIGSAPIPGRVWDVAIAEGYAYVAEGTGDYDGGLHVVDVSDPLSPLLVGSVATIGDAHGVAVSDELCVRGR